MATIVTWSGTNYTVPATGEDNWGGATKVDGLLISLVQNGFNRSGGTFNLLADVDLGSNGFGLLSSYYKSRGANIGTTGVLRLASAEAIVWRNNANSGNLPLTTDASDNLLFNGNILTSSSGVVPVASGGTGIASYTIGDTLYASGATTLSKLAIGAANKVLTSTGSAPSWTNIVNANVDAAAAIAYSKLSLTGSVVNADIGASAAIAYSKLNLTGSVVNADINASAAIAYSKLNLATSVKASDQNSQSSTSGQVLTADGAGNATYQTPPSFPAQEMISNGSIATSVAANALTIALKDQNGADPTSNSKVTIGFRHATATNGTFLSRTVSAALSVVIPSGTTIGTANGQAADIYVYAIDNAGTVELAVSLSRFDEGLTLNTTAVSGGSSASTIYSTTARTGVAIRLIGRVNISEATAGTWASGATSISNVPFGRQGITIQSFTSGSGTYFTPAGCTWIRIRMVGGGGGGGGTGAGAGSGGSGGNSTFGNHTGGLGGGGNSSGAAGIGGIGTIGAGGSGIVFAGSDGWPTGSNAQGGSGGNGGSSFIGGGARAPLGGSASAGVAPYANTGGGGSGASLNAASGAGGGGGAGGVDVIINNPNSSYSYSVGAAGSAGAGANAGGGGGSGLIVVEEHYN